MPKSTDTTRIDILAFDGCMGSTVLGPIELFSMAGALGRLTVRPRPQRHFRARLVSIGGKPVQCASGVALACARAQLACDVLYVPGIWHEGAGDMDAELIRLAPEIAHITRAVAAGVQVVAACAGTLLPAAAGLLDGQAATTSWWLADYLRRRFPRVRVALDRVICTEAPGVWTAGATTAYIDLCLKLIERYADAETAELVGRFMLVDANRPSQGSYAIASLRRTGLDPSVVKVQDWIARNYSRAVTIDMLAKVAAVSTRTLNRRFHLALDTTPLSYLQKVRIDTAKHLIASSSLTIDAIVARSGYDDLGSFRRLFRAHTGLSPREYRERFRIARPRRYGTARIAPKP